MIGKSRGPEGIGAMTLHPRVKGAILTTVAFLISVLLAPVSALATFFLNLIYSEHNFPDDKQAILSAAAYGCLAGLTVLTLSYPICRLLIRVLPYRRKAS